MLRYHTPNPVSSLSKNMGPHLVVLVRGLPKIKKVFPKRKRVDPVDPIGLNLCLLLKYANYTTFWPIFIQKLLVVPPAWPIFEKLIVDP